jgi:protein phosphatase
MCERPSHDRSSRAWRAACLTDRGRKRPDNEDAWLCDVERGLFIVADGMGGKNAGDLASKAVVTVLPVLLRQTLGPETHPSERTTRSALVQALRTLSHDLREKSKNVPALVGLGSTAVVLLLRGGIGHLAHAGDSRGYLLRGKKLSRLTADHTTAAALVRGGHLTPDAAAHSPLAHSLENYVGMPGRLQPSIRMRRLQSEDRWLLCSDGVTKALPDASLDELLRRGRTPEETSEAIVRAANEADGSDNITALIVDVE